MDTFKYSVVYFLGSARQHRRCWRSEEHTRFGTSDVAVLDTVKVKSIDRYKCEDMLRVALRAQRGCGGAAPAKIWKTIFEDTQCR